MKHIAKAIVAVAALTALTAQAEGLYVGGSLGHTRLTGDDTSSLSSDKSATGGKIYGGYTLTQGTGGSLVPAVGIEAGYVNLGKFNSGIGDLKADGVFVDAVGTWPIANNFSALARVGLFSGKLDSSTVGSDRGTRYKLGAGLQYDFSPNTALRAEWERYRFDALDAKPNADLYSIGVNYKF